MCDALRKILTVCDSWKVAFALRSHRHVIAAHERGNRIGSHTCSDLLQQYPQYRISTPSKAPNIASKKLSRVLYSVPPRKTGFSGAPVDKTSGFNLDHLHHLPQVMWRLERQS